MVPHLNELREKYEDEGLTIVGVTNEDEGLVREKVEDAEMEFGVVLVVGKAVDGAYGASRVPHSVLIGRDGKVAWAGHPSNLAEERIRALLE